MAAYRYWRLAIPPNSNYLPALGEVALRETAGGTNIAPLATVSANTASFPAANVVDGNASTFWQATTLGASCWITFDFGATPRDIAEVTLTDIPTNSVLRVRDVVLLYSADGVMYSPCSPGLALGGLPLGGSVTDAVSQTPPAMKSFAAPVVIGGAVPGLSFATYNAPVVIDTTDGGPHAIAGTVTVQGSPSVPVARRVRLHDRPTGRPVREAWSGADGAYAFSGLRAGSWYVTAFDHTGTYNAVIRDQIATG